jgi:exodeoxyribonuclease VII small subunit
MKKNPSFEEAMAELEQTVTKLEGGSMTLEESLLAFERAVKLVNICNERLESAKEKIRILTENADGTVTDAPFSCDEN